MPYLQEADCYFGPVFNGTFDEGSIKDENFNIGYGDGEFLTGVLGYENITVAGLTVDHQEVALVNYSYWFGDSVTSGLMGLAYPLLTSAFEGTNTSADSLSTQVEYDPIITTMIKENIIDPVFSLALDRNSDSGYLALGGLPPVNYTGSFATTPILMVSSFVLRTVHIVGTRDLTADVTRSRSTTNPRWQLNTASTLSSQMHTSTRDRRSELTSRLTRGASWPHPQPSIPRSSL